MHKLNLSSRVNQWITTKQMFLMDSIFHLQGLNLLMVEETQDQGRTGEVVPQTPSNNIKWQSECNKLVIWSFQNLKTHQILWLSLICHTGTIWCVLLPETVPKVICPHMQPLSRISLKMNEPKTQKSKLTRKSKKIRIEQMNTLGIIKDHRIKHKFKEVVKKCPYHLLITEEEAQWT